MQVIEITLTVLATAFPAILTAIVVIELLGVARITQRLNSLIRGMESPESLDNAINTVIGPATPSTPSKPVPKVRKEEIVEEIEEEYDDEIDEDIEDAPVVVTSFDFGDDELAEETFDEPAESETPEPIPEEPMAFEDSHLPDESLGAFELEIDKDGSFELKEEEEKEDEE
ncbi:MAG: hypothetical protein KAR33_00190 [Candidatus Thorarchaeota archaeon]|nr:hypothetical protein [Candidatus Thorarchaeota archaeon]